jgi:hypothetical protein
MNSGKEKSCCAPIIQSVGNAVSCCAPPLDQRMLRFPDGIQCGVIGLDDVLADIYSEGRDASEETAQEIMDRLEAMKNYIPSSDSVLKEYVDVLLKEYMNYIKKMSKG